ncbi:unnamed protein product [Ilex paraguariensis]|uniref:TIR domain-containing protein n=2 Tax=Ilex paraguariensis TaxID=185542 RepID=A0ABC8U9X8_9AQUA
MAAATTQEEEEPSSSNSRYTYHVFLSFRGKNTRKTFTDHLYTALVSSGIRTFRDDDELERGEDIKSVLQKSIQESRMSIIVFSKDYSSSRWCLDELVMILQCKRVFGHMILPVFYDVDPSEVKKQSGSFAEAFDRDEEGFEAEKDLRRKKEWMEKVEEWKAALSEVSDLEDRMVLQNQPDGLEAKFIREIVKVVGRKLNRIILRVAPYPIGIDSRVEGINLWLQDGSTNVGILAIYGIGGIGKSTIAKSVYNLNFDKFDGSSFLANIREASGQPNGLIRLQRQLISDILKKKIKKIYNIDEGIMKIKEAVSCKRILLVLDDVDDLDQLNAVLGMRGWFYPRSKIIITTRHEQLLKAHEVFRMDKVKALDAKESLQLFSWHCFGQDHPSEDYTDLSRNVVYHCQGNPLALQVLGSSLSGRNLVIWESALMKLKAIPDHQILKILRISYDSLPDNHDKNVFLDIACFFVGKDKDYVVMILDCDFFPIVGIQNLMDRCLLTIDNKNKLRMHQLLQDMGREIIRQESPQKPGKRSRVWHHKDSFNLLKEKTGTETIKGLTLDVRMSKEVRYTGTLFNVKVAKRRSSEETVDKLLLADPGYSEKRRRLNFSKHSINANSKSSSDEDLETDAFTGMPKLRIVQLSYVQLTGCYENFPKKLRLLYWRGFPLKSIPNDFPLESLVALDMRNSSLRQVWNGTKVLGLLKILNLSHSHGLSRSPDFSGLPNLNILVLKDCIRLVDVHESVGNLKRLVSLNLTGCKNLRQLPKEIGRLKSLEKLNISGCSKLTKLPMELVEMESLTMFHADGIAIGQLVFPSSEVKSWCADFWYWVSKARKWPQSFNFSLASLSRSLVSLSLANCNLSDDSIPINISSLSLLQYLNLSENPICSLPESIKDLLMLKELWLDSCTSLQSLPELPLSLVELKVIDCTSLERITNLPNLLKSLFLDIFGCKKLVEVQGLFKLEPLGNFHSEFIKNLGFLNLDSIGNTEVELYNKLTETRKTGPVQVLSLCLSLSLSPT